VALLKAAVSEQAGIAAGLKNQRVKHIYAQTSVWLRGGEWVLEMEICASG
jgi:hypothetical protein